MQSLNSAKLNVFVRKCYTALFVVIQQLMIMSLFRVYFYLVIEDTYGYLHSLMLLSVLLLECLIRKVCHIGLTGTLFHCSFTLVGNNIKLQFLYDFCHVSIVLTSSL